MFTSPTAVRMLMRYGEQALGGVEHRRLERIVCAGEVLNPHAWDWLQNHVLGGRVPVLDHMWQTETGGPAFGNPVRRRADADQTGISHHSAARCPSRRGEDDRRAVRTEREGHHGADAPFPGMTPALWGEAERYQRDYWQKIPDVYYSGDSTYIDEDGYFWFCGRADEVIKIAAPSHRHHRGGERVHHASSRRRMRGRRPARRDAR
jgi:acetyl-CoA synthetase